MMIETFTVRPATVGDVPALAHHRVAMFLDIGTVDPADVPALETATAAWMREAIPAGNFLGWVACDAAGAIVGGAGMQLRPIMPRPRPGGGVRSGRQGLLVNVYTERAWRRRGVAEAVVRHAIEDARRLHLASVVLHASTDGRPLYERLGFASTDEMQIDADRPAAAEGAAAVTGRRDARA